MPSPKAWQEGLSAQTHGAGEGDRADMASLEGVVSWRPYRLAIASFALPRAFSVPLSTGTSRQRRPHLVWIGSLTRDRHGCRTRMGTVSANGPEVSRRTRRCAGTRRGTAGGACHQLADAGNADWQTYDGPGLVEALSRRGRVGSSAPPRSSPVLEPAGTARSDAVCTGFCADEIPVADGPWAPIESYRMTSTGTPTSTV